MSKWKVTKVSRFLFEREGKYKPDATEITGLKRIEKIDFQGRFHIATKPSKTNMILVQNGDLVISGINVSKGALGIYEGKEPVTATIHYSSYTFDENQINVEYFKRFLKSPKFIDLLKEQVRGGIKTEIKPKHILGLEIPLPSIAQQEEIVERFRKIETEDADLKYEITCQKNTLNRLRQQILQDAIEGKLTENWRKHNLDVEPASELVNRINQSKEQLRKDKKLGKQKTLFPIADEEKPFELPNNWTWCRLGSLACPQRGITYGIVKMGSKPVADGVYALRCSDIKHRRFMLDNVRKVTEEVSNQYRRTILEGGEILLNIRGTLGGCAIATNDMKGYNIAREVGLIPLLDKSLNNFILDVISSKYFDIQIQKNLRGIAYKGLNLNILNRLLIPLPPLDEQKVISKRVEELLEISDQLERRITENKAISDKFMQAVLKEAFAQTENTSQPYDLELQPSSGKQIDYYKRSLLAAEIVDKLHQEPTLGKLKLQKLIFLCQKTQGMELPTNFLQQAAGPYDPHMARSLEKQFKDKKWFAYRSGELKKYQPLVNAGSHKQDYLKYFANEEPGISYIINLFRKSRSEELEAIATLYACWEMILASGKSYSKDRLYERFYAWSEEKAKFSKEQLSKYIDWMIDNKICPDLIGNS